MRASARSCDAGPVVMLSCWPPWAGPGGMRLSQPAGSFLVAFTW